VRKICIWKEIGRMPPLYNKNIAFLSEDVIKLCISSVAYLEQSFSKLINVQADEIRLIGENNELNIQQMIGLNNVIKRNLRNISRIHMLLMIKLEYIIKAATFDDDKFIVAEPSSILSEAQTAENKITETRLHITNTAHKALNNDNFKKLIKNESQSLISEACICSLIGRGQGIVESLCDAFYDGIAIVQTGVSNACLYRAEQKEEFFCYSVIKGIKMQIFIAYPQSLKFECLKTASGISLKIKGLGSIIFKERAKPDKSDEGSFIFTVCHDEDEPKKNTFEMMIEAKHNSDFNHISGKISTECLELTM
jgi:hypothetical protein